METTKDIDRDVEVLHDELGHKNGAHHARWAHRRRVIIGIVALMLIMFMFGLLTKTTPTRIVVQEIEAIVDAQSPQVVGADLDARLLELRKASMAMHPTSEVVGASATVPRILSWTPMIVGQKTGDGAVVPLYGTYELPAGFFGLVRLISDGEEIGRASVDSRASSVAIKGRFTIAPSLGSGEHLVRLSFDAVKACRIACDPFDQICMATNVDYCVPQYDNQSFLSYVPTKAESRAAADECVEKTLVAGPRYAPQIPEDYDMCTKGMWNADLPAQLRSELVNMGVSDQHAAMFSYGLENFLKRQGEQVVNGDFSASTPDVVVKGEYTHGDAGSESLCIAKVTAMVNCKK